MQVHKYNSTENQITRDKFLTNSQVEDWKFVALPDPDWAFVIWCGFNPVLNYAGGFVLSRHKSLSFLTPEIETQLREATAKFGVNYDDLCISDNTHCKEWM